MMKKVNIRKAKEPRRGRNQRKETRRRRGNKEANNERKK
jgi:hypothetical protein